MGIGAQETIIIVVIALLLFGAPIATFLLGYTLGRRRETAGPVEATSPQNPELPKETPDE